MSDCREIQELISALIDGKVSEKEKAEVYAHVEKCPECKAMLEAFTAVSESLSELEDVPEGLHEDIMRRVKSENIKRKTPWKKIIPLAACLALVIFGAFSLRGMDDAVEDKAVSEVNSCCDGAAMPDKKAAAEDVEIFRFFTAGQSYPQKAGCAADMAESYNSSAQSTDTAAKLRELLTPANDGIGNSDAVNGGSCVQQYTVVFHNADGDETVKIYFCADTAYADFGEGLVEITGTPEEIADLLK